jgi:hypothetical protein
MMFLRSFVTGLKKLANGIKLCRTPHFVNIWTDDSLRPYFSQGVVQKLLCPWNVRLFQVLDDDRRIGMVL